MLNTGDLGFPESISLISVFNCDCTFNKKLSSYLHFNSGDAMLAYSKIQVFCWREVKENHFALIYIYSDARRSAKGKATDQ